jgi:hypothetical protein
MICGNSSPRFTGVKEEEAAGNNGGNTRLDPLLNGVDTDKVDEMIAFLHTLDCPAPSPDLLAP